MWYCTKCGSNDVEGKCYVNINTLKIEEYPEWDNTHEAYWCNNCQDCCDLTEDPDEYKDWDDINKGEEKFESKRDNI